MLVVLSNGANKKVLKYTLPCLFAWLIIMSLIFNLCNKRRADQAASKALEALNSEKEALKSGKAEKVKSVSW